MKHISRCIPFRIQLRTLLRGIHATSREIIPSEPLMPLSDPILAAASPPIEEVIEDNETKTENQEIRKLLKKFILPIDYHTSKDPNGESNEFDLLDNLENDALRNLYFNWNIPTSKLLPLYNNSNSNPYEFHSTTNADNSYVTSPRLSVTKLLTNSWCELRDFYNIYAGSPGFKPTAAIKLGLKRHTALETETHVIIDSISLTKFLTRHMKQNIEVYHDLIEATDDENLLLMYESDLEAFNKFAIGNKQESELALEWCDQIITRMFSLIRTSEAREILVHGFLNLHDREFLSTTEQLESFPYKTGDANENRVLVSGIVDYFSLTNSSDPDDYDLFEEINDYLQREYQDVSVDMTRYFEDIPSIMKKYAGVYKLKTTDVKTRSSNYVPGQRSVIEAAKHQIFFYRKMMGLLSNESGDDPHFAYHSLIENAKVRGLDVDEPINVISLITILRKYPKLLLNDFVKLSQGEPIGFEPFDEYCESNPFEGKYNISSIIETAQNIDVPYERIKIDDLVEIDPFNFHDVFPQEVMGNWVTPPTLRYFAARGSQFYALIKDLLGDETSVEYHNGRTNRCFKTVKYKYDIEVLNKQTTLASTFWTGERFPSHTNDHKMCGYCSFRSQCLIPNSDLPVDHNRKLLGPKISQFLHS
ncbi:mitochondrial exonuclease V [Scheffersomyces coipomensis]|uniref:mitochondrial exonuclease V n=1 Tax=Scheffersomyces coipomensis TaxID=1788519 RepID=UPI00315D9898